MKRLYRLGLVILGLISVASIANEASLAETACGTDPQGGRIVQAQTSRPLAQAPAPHSATERGVGGACPLDLDRPEAIVSDLDQRNHIGIKLIGQKKVVTVDHNGNEQVTWETLTPENALVQAGDLIRYVVWGENISDRQIQNLTVTQPIPPGMIYVPSSATKGVGPNTTVSFSIDNGQTFAQQPMIEVIDQSGQSKLEPAPVETYTHVRWEFGGTIVPKVVVKANYDVELR